MTHAKKIGYVLGSIFGALVLLVNAVVFYITSHTDAPFHCQAMLKFFGATDCSLNAQSNYLVVILIAAALVVMGGFIGELVGRLAPTKK